MDRLVRSLPIHVAWLMATALLGCRGPEAPSDGTTL